MAMLIKRLKKCSNSLKWDVQIKSRSASYRANSDLHMKMSNK